MKKALKIVLGISIILNIILLVKVLQQNSASKCGENILTRDKIIKKYVGIYHNSTWNNVDHTLKLNEDMSCEHPASSMNCTWNIDGDTITFKFDGFQVEGNSISGITKTKEECEKFIEDAKEMYKKNMNVNVDINGTCKYITGEDAKAIVVNDGILIDSHVFNKIS